MLARDAVQVMVRVMSPYIGDTMARSATEAHCHKLGVGDGPMSDQQLEALLAKVGAGLNIFLGREKAATVIAEIRRELQQRATVTK